MAFIKFYLFCFTGTIILLRITTIIACEDIDTRTKAISLLFFESLPIMILILNV